MTLPGIDPNTSPGSAALLRGKTTQPNPAPLSEAPRHPDLSVESSPDPEHDDIPRCPKCSSNDLIITPESQLECQFCGHEFRITRQKVPYLKPVPGGADCPMCGYKRVPVTSTRAAKGNLRERWHKCPCGHAFTSTEDIDK